MIRLVAIALFLVTARGIQQPRLVYPRLLEERSPDGRMVLHLHDGLTLNLRKASVAAPEFRVLEHEDGREVTHLFNGEELDRHLHEDEKQLASVHVMQKETGVEVEGVVGPYHRIQPMPEMERSEDGLVPHMIHEIEKKEMFDIEMEPRDIEVQRVKERTDGAQNVPATVIIELFMVSDRPHHSFFATTMELIRYFCVQVNSVNLRYTETSRPNVQFSLVGVEKDVYSTYKKGDGNFLESSPTLDAFRVYAHNKKHEYGTPDMVYLATGFEVFIKGPNNTKNTNALGIGYVAGVCTTHFVALGQDTAGTHNGMHTLAHESGHVLGASHDESPPKSWVHNDPGSLSCKWQDGFMMSYVDGGPRHHRFSRCSLDQIQNVIRAVGWKCWTVIKKDGYTKKGWYAGMYVTANDYCRKAVFPGKQNVTADLTSPRVKDCKLKCQYPTLHQKCYSQYGCYTYQKIHYILENALDYMYCGEKMVCMRGVCVSKSAEVTEDTKDTTETTESTTTAVTTPSVVDDDKCRCDCSTTVANAPVYPPRPITPGSRNPHRNRDWNNGYRKYRK
uniref:Putative tick metalloprotease 1 n=1 Tax=Amblyomma parvum TaxID=251391 RepID=A0A023FYW7_AMBPA